MFHGTPSQFEKGFFTIASCIERIRNGISYGQIHLLSRVYIYLQVKNARLQLHLIVYDRRVSCSVFKVL